MKSTTSKVLIIIAFLAILLLPVVASDKVGGAPSPNENRYLAKFPTVIVEKNKIAPGLKNGFEAWLKDNLAAREEAQRVKAYIDLRLFASSPSRLVHIGEDGWYFYTNDRNLEIGHGAHLFSNEELEAIRLNQVAIQTSLKEQGIDYVLALIPSKASVYPEFIKGGSFQIGTTLIDQVTTYLQEKTTIPVINVKPELINAKNEQDVYFRTETHWNHAGAYIGYKAIINRLNELGMIQTQPVSISTEPATHNGEFSAMMGYPGLLPPEPFAATVIQNPQASLVNDSEKISQVKKIIADYDIVGEYFSYSNPSAEKSALILGDSFFFTWKIPDLFAENFAEMNFIRTDIFANDIIQTIDPDIVIFERTERYIYSMANSANVKLEIPLHEDLSAEIISHDTPTTVERGESYNINIVVKNTGDQDWSEDDQIRLCIFQDGKDFGYRINLPSGVKVDPDQEYTFVLYNFRVNDGDSTYLEYQMVKEGYHFFGEKERVDIVVE
jgi:hypothetical protein